MSNLSRKAFDKQILLACKGYNPKFINQKTAITVDGILSDKMKKELPTVEGNNDGILHYSDLSVYYHENRKIPFFQPIILTAQKRQIRLVEQMILEQSRE